MRLLLFALLFGFALPACGSSTSSSKDCAAECDSQCQAWQSGCLACRPSSSLKLLICREYENECLYGWTNFSCDCVTQCESGGPVGCGSYSEDPHERFKTTYNCTF